MSETEEKLRAYLGSIHPQYEEARRLGRRVFRLIRRMLEEDDPLASRAVYLAALLGGEGGSRIVEAASIHSNSVVRMTAAYSLPRIPRRFRKDLLLALLTDRDDHVTYRAILAAAQMKQPSVPWALASLLRLHPAPYVRAAAGKALLSLES